MSEAKSGILYLTLLRPAFRCAHTGYEVADASRQLLDRRQDDDAGGEQAAEAHGELQGQIVDLGLDQIDGGDQIAFGDQFGHDEIPGGFGQWASACACGTPASRSRLA